MSQFSATVHDCGVSYFRCLLCTWRTADATGGGCPARLLQLDFIFSLSLPVLFMVFAVFHAFEKGSSLSLYDRSDVVLVCLQSRKVKQSRNIGSSVSPNSQSSDSPRRASTKIATDFPGCCAENVGAVRPASGFGAC